jgi:hypothetical protein
VQIGIVIAHHVGMVSLRVLGCDHCFVGMIMSKFWMQAIFQLIFHITFVRQDTILKNRVMV